MPRPGFRNDGFLVPHFLFGGNFGGEGIVDSVYSSPASLTADAMARSVTVSALLRTYNTLTGNTCYKIFANDSVTINTGGTISCSAQGKNGTSDHQVSGTPFGRGGSLGGSGGGGASVASGNGQDGLPSDIIYKTYLGGIGGYGGQNGIHNGGIGGGYNFPSPAFDPVNNFFQASIWQSGMVWCTPSGETFADWVGSDRYGYVATPISGGCGGGGCGDNGSAGGGGCGGGVVYIAADRIVMNGGHIDADGQSVQANTGGGGGGGGAIVLVCNELIWANAASTIHAVGGTGGDLGARNGYDGYIMVFSNQTVTTFTGLLDKSIYEEAVRRYQLKGTLLGS